MGDNRKANTGGRRNEKPLTEEQKRQVKEYAVSLGMPEEKIEISDFSLTSYAEGYDFLIIGTDVYPLEAKSDVPNDNISWRGVLAHEIIGHREAGLNGLTQTDKFWEEAQASIRAARFAPELSESERETLLADAEYRLTMRGEPVRSVMNKLHINER